MERPTTYRDLMDLQEASRVLTAELGRGYSVPCIRSYIRDGAWTLGVEYIDDSLENAKRRRIKVRVKDILKAKGVEV